MTPAAALVAPACYAAEPAPLVRPEVYRALLGEPTAAGPAKADVAAAIQAVTPLRRRRGHR